MSTADVTIEAPRKSFAAGLSAWAIVFLLTGPAIVLVLCRNVLPSWAVLVPNSWVVPFIDWINAVVKFLRKEPIFFGYYSFKDLTRAIANLVNYPLDFVEGLLISGFNSWGLPPLPWVMIAGLAAVYGWYLKGPKLAVLAGGAITFMAFFGKWKLSMITLSTVLVAAPIAAAIGLSLGVLAFRKSWFETIMVPFLNIMQSLPHFSYLIPVAVFIGVGHKAGTIATIIFAIPPMARLTLLGLRGVPSEVREAGVMAGCTKRQMLRKVEVPAARHALMVGVNQVIMQCLAMVVIAAFIGAKGLGHDLLFRLQSLRIGQAFEIGVIIVLMAIALDRLSQAAVEKEPEHAPEGPFWLRHPYLSAAAGVIIVSIVAVLITPLAMAIPRAYTVTMAPFWDRIVDFITIEFYDPLQFFRNGLLVNVLIPMKSAFQQIPWTALVALVAVVGGYLGGMRLALVCTALVLFIAFSGFWERSLITAYMVTFAVIVCVLIGLPIGIWASKSERRTRAAQVVLDTMQTFPSFIYLLPVIMLFRVGDVAAVSAIVIYAIIPVVRYTIFGLRSVPSEIVEAGLTSGCTSRQLLWKVRMPFAFPEIMLGLNQTIMFALFMVIIAGFIGTTDLGQEIFRALTFNDAGKGLVVGLCVAFMGLTADQLITAWAAQRKKQLGIN